MSKESQVPLQRVVVIGDDDRRIVDERFRRYPIRDRRLAEALGGNPDTGHHEPRPRRRSRR